MRYKALLITAFATVLAFALSLLAFIPDAPLEADEEAPVADVSVLDDILTLSEEALDNGDFETVSVVRQPLYETLEVTGRIQVDEDRTARVGSPVEGRVGKIHVKLGDSVKAGQALFEIHSFEFLSARTAYAKAQANLAVTERKMRQAQTELERANRLLAAKAISEREQLAAAVEATASEKELEHARAEAALIEHHVQDLGVEPAMGPSSDLFVRAPISGVVLERQVTLGTVVNPADDLAIISDLSSLWAVAEVPERQAALVRANQPAEILVAAFPDRRFPARIFHLSESLDPDRRTVLVRSVVENTERLLRPEMYATTHIHLGESAPLLTVPVESIHTVDGQTVVYVELEEGKFEQRVIEAGRTVDDMTEVQDGLMEGERIVSRGSFLIKTEFLRASIEAS